METIKDLMLILVHKSGQSIKQQETQMLASIEMIQVAIIINDDFKSWGQ